MEQQLSVGGSIDMLTHGELKQSLDDQAQHLYMAFARGVKFLRFGPWAQPVANSAVTFDGSKSSGTGPKEGFVWSVKRIVVTGLTVGTTPDIINIWRGAPGVGAPLWQLNGNSFGATFGKGDLIMLPGEYLSFQNVGALAAATNTQIAISGDVLECAAEEIIKIV